MSSSPPLQDMPPPGGYHKINYQRVPAKVSFSGYKLFSAFVLMQFGALYYRAKYIVPWKKRHELELQSALLATTPFLVAERDRAVLLQMRRNRDAEAELMKDVEGWEVGTYMGEPIYKSLDANEWTNPKTHEYFSHSDPQDYYQFRDCHYRR